VNPEFELVQWVALSLIPNLGSRTMANLLDHFGSLDAVLEASEPDLRAVPRIGPRLAAAIRSVDLARTQQDIAAWLADGISIVLRAGHPTPGSVPYPAALAGLPDAPPVLFLRGTVTPGDQRGVALVGTRRPTPESRALAATLAAALVAHGWTVISGLADGIDAAAHGGALRAGGRTLAVLGCGVRTIYPPGSGGLASRILAHGALLSETHPDAPPNSPALVARNRLISGLSRAVIIIEAGDTSGSLHAARFAQAQGRAVYAIDNGAPGNQQLLAGGAVPLPPDPGEWESIIAEMANQS
jgi:DNA processing protein